MKSYPLAVISPSFGNRSETFIYRHMTELLPGETVVVARRKGLHLDDHEIRFPHLVLGEFKLNWQWLFRGSLYFWRISKLSPVQVKVEKYLRQYGVKVILSEYLDQSIKWLDVAKKMGIRFFAHAHGYDVSQALRNPATRQLYLLLDAADGIITMSEISRNRLIRLGLRAEKIHIIPYGIYVPHVSQCRNSNNTIRCLAVGRMVAKKAPLNTLEAFRRAFASNPRLRLDFIGDGELFAEARQFVNDHALDDIVLLHGSQPNPVVQGFMKNADIFLQHSQTDSITGDEEGLPVAILEAMANSLPVISTRHAGIPEAVIEGVTGYLGDEGDVEKMTAHIVQLANSSKLRNQFGQAGWERAKEHFSWDQEKSELLKVLGFEMPINTCNNPAI
jgi:glycosyltransferase involved in cell wall biosynthesis